eukprot:CAMPEP_0115638900 /NCGR_PEP_ID=MMETSP0272-20121206/34980_1 /TAXON_ID=71861 /ORGANISM="Scrippsiella trochoidea, Strain CCMP3099" /LENGTH=52 /DNA_ID=CAMNT_0003076065 /DNA_START=290 /DNA_END=444 /DNA_ORIENTATION=+
MPHAWLDDSRRSSLEALPHSTTWRGPRSDHWSVATVAASAPAPAPAPAAAAA